MRIPRLRYSLLAACAAASIASAARAQPAQPAPTLPVVQDSSGGVFGVVVAVEQDDLVLDLGAARGVAVGEVVELWRPLRLKHPVTGQVVSDRFLIGRLRLTQVRPSLALAQADGPPHRPPAPGDIVVARPAVVAPSQPTPPAAPGAEVRPQDPEALELSRMFDSLRGADLRARILAYEGQVQKNPRGRFAVVLYEEAQALRKLLERPKAPPAVVAEPAAPAVASAIVADSVVASRATVSRPLTVAVSVRGGAGGAVLFVRRSGGSSFAPYPMRRAGGGYFTAQIPAQSVQPPGVEYFVEVARDDRQMVPALGSSSAPLSTAVDALPTVPPERFLASATILTDYASFNAKAVNDYAWQTEGQFGLRFGDEGMRALRSGFGVYRGKAASLAELDRGRPARTIGLTYGTLEGEWGFSRTFSVALRGVIGLRDDGVTGGAQAYFRIGSDRDTNLLLGGEVLGGVGLRGITQFEWNTFKRVPILLRSEVTNQPAGVSGAALSGEADQSRRESGDVGVRAIVQVGYRFLPELTVAGRLTYQGRTINHAGPGAGAAVSYEW